MMRSSRSSTSRASVSSVGRSARATASGSHDSPTCSSRNGSATAISSIWSIRTASPTGSADSSTTAPLPMTKRRGDPPPRRSRTTSRSPAFTDRGDRRAQHRRLGFGFRNAAALDLVAGGVDDGADHREVPRDGQIPPEDALFLATLDQGLELVEHGEMTAVELLGREPGGVEREKAVELRELPPRSSKHSLERLDRLAALGLGAAHRVDDLCNRVLH